jgi:hypothetical protein
VINLVQPYLVKGDWVSASYRGFEVALTDVAKAHELMVPLINVIQEESTAGDGPYFDLRLGA